MEGQAGCGFDGMGAISGNYDPARHTVKLKAFCSRSATRETVAPYRINRIEC
jgi:hypothetical protein